MIDPDKRKAIFLLHQEGMSVREIAQRLGISRNTVKVIIQQEGVMPPKRVRSDQQRIDPELLRQLYQQCQGWVRRMHEKLLEEHHLQIKYSTLTRLVRALGLGAEPAERCARVPDEPGAEMQHDTTIYQITLADQRVRMVATLLYLRYSKRRYLKFSRTFNRFQMKGFLHEALRFWGYAPRQCIIDNTNLARLHGTGARAVIVPEMEAFSRQYGFVFRCHERNHPDRKAGEERSFWIVETNFLPGRVFQSLEDLNQQALKWATVRLEHKPQGKAGLIPAQAFEQERPYLTPLPAQLPAPYQVHDRAVDQYGYIAFDGNYYWVPGTGREPVKVLQYSERLKIYRERESLAEYLLPVEGVKNKTFTPEGIPVPVHPPIRRQKPAHEEEKRLRALGEGAGVYLDFALATPGLQRHQFLRKLFLLSQRMTPELFLKTLARACRYGITSLATLESIARLHLAEGWTGHLGSVEIDPDFQQRPAYQEGFLTEQPDLSAYQDPINPTDPTGPSNPQDHE